MCLYERIAKVSDELQRIGVSVDFVNELNDVCDQIDSIDRELEEAEKAHNNIPGVRKKLYGVAG